MYDLHWLKNLRNQAWLCGFLLLFSCAAVADSSTAKQQINEQQAAAMLDYEILLLRAEIAHKTNRIEAFDNYMQQLGAFVAPNKFATRYEVLQILWHQMDIKVAVAPEPTDFAAAKYAKTIVLLLPLSGDYASAGQAMLEPMERGFASQKTYVIDSGLYEDMSELWSLAKMFDPDLIIGPLSKQKAQAIVKLNQNIPMLTFTSVDKDSVENPYIWSLASMNQSYALAFREMFENFEISDQAWLSDGSKSAKTLIEVVNQQNQQNQQDTQNKSQAAKLDSEQIQYGVDRSLAKLMGSEASTGRKNWLARTTGSKLEFDARIRQDKHLIVALLPQRQAVQVVPMVNYYQLKTPVIWVPTQLPSLEKFKQNLSNWHQTYALLPANLTYQLNEKSAKNPEDSQVGLFYALADLAIALINYADQQKPFRFKHDLGWIYVDKAGNYYLEASLYQLHKGSFKLVESTRFLQ